MGERGSGGRLLPTGVLAGGWACAGQERWDKLRDAAC